MGIAERKARIFQKREEEILEAAFDLFLEKGIENTSLDMIAEIVEIGKSTIYKHFTSKHEIYAVLFLRHLDQIQKEIDAVDASLPVIEKLRLIIRICLKYWVMKSGNNKVFLDCMSHMTLENLGPQLLEKVTYRHKIYHERLMNYINEAIEAGFFGHVSPGIVLLITEGLMRGVGEMLADHNIEYKDNDLNSLFQMIENVLVNGLINQ